MYFGEIKTIISRHEQGAAYMAYGYSKATGKPGAFSVVPGPGVLNTTAALCTAAGGNVPLLCMTGQVPAEFLGVATGFKELDKKLSGFQKSDLVILAGRPSMGKTALALSMARNAAVEHNMKVGVFSLEMSCSQLTERLITAEAKVDSHLVRDGRLPAKDC